LQDTGLLQPWLEQRLREALRAQPELQQQLLHSFEQQLPSLFLRLRASLDRVVIRLLSHSDAGLAREWFFRLQSDPSDATFASLLPHSCYVSLPAPQQRLGYYGPLCLGDLHPALAQPLRRCAPGTVLPPLAYNDAPLYAVIQLLEHQPAQLTPDLHSQLCETLERNWIQQRLEELLQTPPPAGTPFELVIRRDERAHPHT
jgi:hypothetical protein